MKLFKLFLEMTPLVIFFITYKYMGLMEATVALMITTTLSIIVFWFVFKKVATMPLVTAALVLVFGGLTLYFDDTFFIKIKKHSAYSVISSDLKAKSIIPNKNFDWILGHTHTPIG